MREKVKRGVRLLDKKIPNWRSKIDSETIDMAGIMNCVLGQLYGNYQNGLIKLFGRDTDFETRRLQGIAHGFQLTDEEHQNYALLDHLWKVELNKKPPSKLKRIINFFRR